MSDEDRIPRNRKFLICEILLAVLGVGILFAAFFYIVSPYDRDRNNDGSPLERRDVPINSLSHSATNFRGLDGNGFDVISRTFAISTEAGVGSGLMLTHDLMMTAAHILPPDYHGQPVKVYCRRGTRDIMQPIQGQVENFAPDLDVALVSVPGCVPENVPTLQLRTDALSRDLQLHMFGFEIDPSQQVPCFTGIHRATSFIDRLSHIPLNYPRQLDMIAGLAEHGNSGGPVFTGRGEIVGMIVIIQAEMNRTLMVPAATIQKFLISNGHDQFL